MRRPEWRTCDRDPVGEHRLDERVGHSARAMRAGSARPRPGGTVPRGGCGRGERRPVDHQVRHRRTRRGGRASLQDAASTSAASAPEAPSARRRRVCAAAEPVGLGVDPVHQTDADLGRERERSRGSCPARRASGRSTAPYVVSRRARRGPSRRGVASGARSRTAPRLPILASSSSSASVPGTSASVRAISAPCKRDTSPRTTASRVSGHASTATTASNSARRRGPSTARGRQPVRCSANPRPRCTPPTAARGPTAPSRSHTRSPWRPAPRPAPPRPRREPARLQPRQHRPQRRRRRTNPIHHTSPRRPPPKPTRGRSAARPLDAHPHHHTGVRHSSAAAPLPVTAVPRPGSRRVRRMRPTKPWIDARRGTGSCAG